MSQTFRATELWLIAGAVAIVAIGLWGVGVVVDSPMLRYIGFMTGATTFLPLPADAYVLNAVANSSALAVGVVGGAVNAAVALVERQWLIRLARHPVFDRFGQFIGSNRWVDMAQRHFFVGLVIGGFSFLPFEPFRLVAVIRDYQPSRYALATFLGRGFRYYWLARIGAVFAIYGAVKYLVWASLLVFAVGVAKSYVRYRSVVEGSPGIGES